MLTNYLKQKQEQLNNKSMDFYTPTGMHVYMQTPVDGVDVELTLEENGVLITAIVHTTWKTGVEMEALTAVSASALTLYDMIKSMDKGVRITDIQLLEKIGGKSGDWKRNREV